MPDLGQWLNFSNTQLTVKRSLWSYHKVQSLVAKIVKNHRIQLHFLDVSAEYLNVGCGPVILPGFCNMDFQWRPGVLCWDVTKGIPFENASFQGIFSEHCLEHIAYEQCLSVLREFHRTLRPGGVARIIVPDGELYCRLYVQDVDARTADWPYSEPNTTPMTYVNRIMRNHGHQFIYDFQTLREAMLQAGFKEVHRRAYLQGRESNLLVDQRCRAVESLYVEGIA